MKIDLRFCGLEASDSLREHAVRRIHFHLSRFGQDVSAVVVRIGDVNGPRGGLDKRCRITVRGPRFRSSSIEELSTDAYAAVGSAVARVARAVGRDLERARDAKVMGSRCARPPEPSAGRGRERSHLKRRRPEPCLSRPSDPRRCARAAVCDRRQTLRGCGGYVASRRI